MKKILFLLIFSFSLFLPNLTKIKAETYSCLPADECLNKAPLCQIINNEEENQCKSSCNESCCKCITEEEKKIIDKKKYGNYDLQDIVDEAIDKSNLLLGIVGSIALLFFIIAGIKMIFSAGNDESVKNAKAMMTQTIIGLIIFLGAYLIVSFIQKTLITPSEKTTIYKLNNSKYK